jgi:hypothetical protein
VSEELAASILKKQPSALKIIAEGTSEMLKPTYKIAGLIFLLKSRWSLHPIQQFPVCRFEYPENIKVTL